MDIDSMIAVLQAAKEGKTIQSRPMHGMHGDWLNNNIPSWNFAQAEYRVKPEPVVVGLKVECVDGRFWYGTNSMPNLELTFEDGKLVGAKVL